MNSGSARGILLCITLLTLTHSTGARAEESRIQVSAGDWDRRQTVVMFPLALKGAEVQVRDEAGNVSPVQIESGGQASFILENLPKGGTKSFEVISRDAKQKSSVTGVQVTRTGKKLKVTSAGKTVLEYQAEPGELPRPDIDPIFQRGGYIHPVLTPSGRQVTDDYPANHKHHHGIWFPWTRTQFEGREPDFWNMGDGKGRIEFVSLEKTWNGPVNGGFHALHRFVDLTSGAPKAALNERWEVRIYAINAPEKAYWMFDLLSAQQCASRSPLTLVKYYYGGLGVRGNWAWNGTNNTFFLTSEGETNRVKGNTTRARWCDMSGRVDGKQSGLAILCHPDNFRAPQPMRLHPSEPFFCYAPSQIAADPADSNNKLSFQIKAGDTYVSRYRFVVHDGPADRAELDRLWNDYAHPPNVTVSH
jgi:hypothetical protein